MRALELIRYLRRSALICAALAASLALWLGAPSLLDAKSRDADASRMQARKVAFPSNHSDTLNPPEDSIDWRYFKLDEAKRVSIRADFEATEIGAEIAVTGATGRQVATARAGDKRASIAQRLDPGVYYVSVNARKASSYRLSLR